MTQTIAALALLVRDYDEAITYYTGVLDFELLEDTKLSEQKRWVMVRPPGGVGSALVLAKASDEVQSQCIGKQAGGRVFLFLSTDDFAGDFARYQSRGVTFLETPRMERYGKVVVFEDIYGNRWDLIERK